MNLWETLEVVCGGCRFAQVKSIYGNTGVSRFMGSRSHPHRVLSVCVRMCEQVSVGVCD